MRTDLTLNHNGKTIEVCGVYVANIGLQQSTLVELEIVANGHKFSSKDLSNREIALYIERFTSSIRGTDKAGERLRNPNYRYDSIMPVMSKVQEFLGGEADA